MISYGPAYPLASGLVLSCGVLLAVAGASKVYRGARGIDGDTAIRRALRIPRRRWRRVELGVGILEGAVGVTVCTAAYPRVGGVAMAALGALFCALLGYVRVKRVPGGCGCIEWRPSAFRAAPVSWREIGRSALLTGAGVTGTLLPRDQAGPWARSWFYAGILAGGAVLVLLSLRTAPRTPVCRRALWLPARATLRALAGHGVFEAMAASAGPFGPEVRYRRTGCTEEFWFTQAPGTGGARVVFQASYAAGGALAVQALLRDGPSAADEAPPRVIGARPSIAWPSIATARG